MEFTPQTHRYKIPTCYIILAICQPVYRLNYPIFWAIDIPTINVLTNLVFTQPRYDPDKVNNLPQCYWYWFQCEVQFILSLEKSHYTDVNQIRTSDCSIQPNQQFPVKSKAYLYYSDTAMAILAFFVLRVTGLWCRRESNACCQYQHVLQKYLKHCMSRQKYGPCWTAHILHIASSKYGSTWICRIKDNISVKHTHLFIIGISLYQQKHFCNKNTETFQFKTTQNLNTVWTNLDVKYR